MVGVTICTCSKPLSFTGHRRGKRQRLRKQLRAARTYSEWVSSAKALDSYLGLDLWKESDAFAYYDYNTIRRILNDMRQLRNNIERSLSDNDSTITGPHEPPQPPSLRLSRQLPEFEELRTLLEACIRSNFGGIESSRLYSQTYYGTKNLLQEFTEEGKLIFLG